MYSRRGFQLPRRSMSFNNWVGASKMAKNHSYFPFTSLKFPILKKRGKPPKEIDLYIRIPYNLD